MKVRKLKTIVTTAAAAFVLAGCSGQNGATTAERAAPASTNTTVLAGQSQTPADRPTRPTLQKRDEGRQAPATVAIEQGKAALFDNAHREIFTPLNKAGLGYSTVYDMLERYGYSAIRISTKPLTDAILKDVDAVVVPGPMDRFSDQEVKALMKYVNDGGDLLLALHLAAPAAQLSEGFGLQLSSAVVAQSHDTLENKPKWFITGNIADDPLTGGVSSIAVQASWALRATGENARIIVSSAPDAWADINPDDAYEKGEPVAAYGLIGVATAGKGRVVIVADDAVLTNDTLALADNRRLLENILKWFESSKR